MHKKNKIIGLIQARMGSKRLPGKMLMMLGKFTILEWVIKRSLKSKLIDDLILLTSDLRKDDILIKKAHQLGIKTFRGSETNVLNRFASAANKFDCDIAVRICADNPFVDSTEIDRLINYHLKNNFDYCLNNQNKLGSNYADGFGVEIINNKILQFLEKNINSSYLREHVTLGVFEEKYKFKISALKAPKELSYPEMKFDIDTIDDLNKLKEIINNGINLDSTGKEIIEANKKLRKS